jgi:hypothetical protein
MTTKTITVQVELLTERYNGTPTGRDVYHCSTQPGDRSQPARAMGGVLGRGYTPREAMRDFARRARLDGFGVDATDLDAGETIDRRDLDPIGHRYP